MEVLFASLPHHCFWCFFGPGGLSYVQIGPGIQNFTKILPTYMRTRVSHCLMYAQGHQETKVIFLKNFIAPIPQTVWIKIRRFSDFPTHKLNCTINGTVHIFFLKKSYLSPHCPKLLNFFS